MNKHKKGPLALKARIEHKVKTQVEDIIKNTIEANSGLIVLSQEKGQLFWETRELVYKVATSYGWEFIISEDVGHYEKSIYILEYKVIED